MNTTETPIPTAVQQVITASRTYVEVLETVGSELADGLVAVDTATRAYLLERLDDVATALSERIEEIGTRLADAEVIQDQTDLGEASADLSNAGTSLRRCASEIDPDLGRYDIVIL